MVSENERFADADYPVPDRYVVAVHEELVSIPIRFDGLGDEGWWSGTYWVRSINDEPIDDPVVRTFATGRDSSTQLYLSALPDPICVLIQVDDVATYQVAFYDSTSNYEPTFEAIC